MSLILANHHVNIAGMQDILERGTTHIATEAVPEMLCCQSEARGSCVMFSCNFAQEQSTTLNTMVHLCTPYDDGITCLCDDTLDVNILK